MSAVEVDSVPAAPRVAFAHYGTAADVSGVTTWLQNLLPELARQGTQTSILLHHFASEAAPSFLTSSIGRFLGQHIDVYGENRFEYTEEAICNTLKFLNEIEPVCFLPQCLPEFCFAAQFAEKSGLPWIFTIHSDDPDYWAMAEQCASSSPRHAWVAVSHDIAQKAKTIYPEADVRVIPYGVSIPDKKAVLHSDHFRVVYSGRLEEGQKRVSLVVQSLIQACEMCPLVEGVILGHGTAQVSMQKAVENAGMGSRIHFRGRLEADQLQEELLNAQAILLMSDFEGLPVALLEGMAAGLVPIARKIESGIPELVVDSKTGILVNESPDFAGNKIAELAVDNATWQRLSFHARSLVQTQYSDDDSQQKWSDLISELCTRSTVSYPLRLPNRYRLPPVHPSLTRLDIRQPVTPTFLGQKVDGLKRRAKEFIKRILTWVTFSD